MRPPPSQPVHERWWLRRIVNRLEVDRAVFYVLVARGWQLVSGPVTMLLIALFFTPELQGYYYTFGSVAALASLAELGLYTVLINVASHEWSRLHMDNGGRIAGDSAALSRLASLGRRGVVWYSGAAAVFVAGGGAAGWLLFRQKSTVVNWETPWVALVAISGATLAITPLTAILEGCNQMRVVHRFRAVQAIVGSLVAWIAIARGAGLWTAVAAAAVRLFWEAWLVGITYRRFFRPFLSAPAGPRVSWRAEVWPLQWRMAVQAVTAYFAFNLFTPVLFHFHGEVAAAQMGMTWTALMALAVGAYAWVQTRAPMFGMLVARREFEALDRVFLRLVRISTAVLACGGAAFCGGVALFNLLPYELTQKLAARVLPPLPTVVLTAGVLLLHVPRCLGLYLHVHKRDPLLAAGTIANATLGLLVFFLGRMWGAPGAAFAFLGIVLLVYLPAWFGIWRRCRREWHEPDPAWSPTHDSTTARV